MTLIRRSKALKEHSRPQRAGERFRNNIGGALSGAKLSLEATGEQWKATLAKLDAVQQNEREITVKILMQELGIEKDNVDECGIACSTCSLIS